MQDDDRTEWTWKPAQLGRGRRPEVVAGALIVMAASCLAAGFVIGRTTARPPAVTVAQQGGRLVSGDTPAAPVTSGVSYKKQPERDTALAAPSVVILNPGTADVGKQEANDAPSSPPHDASRLRREVRNPDPRDNPLPAAPDRSSGGGDRRETGAATERDYHALRDYMLKR